MLQNNKLKIKRNSERSFGFFFSFLLMLIFFYQIIKYQYINYSLFIISLILFSLALFLPKILILPNKIWFKIGLILNSIVSPLVMGIIFFLVVTPISILMKIFNKDLLRLKLDNKKKTYWITRKNLLESMKNQF